MMESQKQPIGVLDSGVGGVSVLRELVKALPKEDFIYYGDNLNAPYGTREEAEIRGLTARAVEHLRAQGVKAVVIACNTATSAAAEILREHLDLPIVGMEPALKPAQTHHASGKIAVMATPATLRQKKFLQLMEKYGRDAVALPCPGLMEFAERGEIDSPALDALLKKLLSPLAGEAVESAVLGCTHYVFLRRAILKALPGAVLYDGNEGTARRLANLLAERDLLNPQPSGRVAFETSGDEAVFLPVMRRLYEMKL